MKAALVSFADTECIDMKHIVEQFCKAWFDAKEMPPTGLFEQLLRATKVIEPTGIHVYFRGQCSEILSVLQPVPIFQDCESLLRAYSNHFSYSRFSYKAQRIVVYIEMIDTG